MSKIQKIPWNTIEKERLSDFLARQTVSGEKGTLAQFFAKRGGAAARHSHVSEEYLWIISGALKFVFDDREVGVHAGEVLVIPPNVPPFDSRSGGRRVRRILRSRPGRLAPGRGSVPSQIEKGGSR